MNDEKDKRRRGSQLDFNSKVGGKIKRIPPKAQNDGDAGFDSRKKAPKRQSSSKNKNKTNARKKSGHDNHKAGFGISKRDGNIPTERGYHEREYHEQDYRDEAYLPERSESTKKRISQKNLKVIEGGKSPKKMMKKRIIVGICAVLVIVAALFSFTRPTGIGEWIKVKTSSAAAGDGFPVSFSDSAASGIYREGNSLLTLGSTEIRCYNSNGGLIFSRLHGFTTPILRLSKMRFLTFDRGGNQYRIDTCAENVSTAKCDERIIDADIADNGNYVIATLSNSEKSLVTVYDKSGNEKYKFHSADDYVSSVAISKNGKTVAINKISAKNGVISSEISLYSINSTEAKLKKSYENETVYLMSFCDNKTVRVISNKAIKFMNVGGDVKEKSYDGKTLVKYEFLKNGNTLLALAGASNSAQNTIVILSKSADVVTSFEINNTVNAISADNNTVYVLSNMLYSYSYTGEQTNTWDIQAGAVGLKTEFGAPFVLYSTSIEKMN